MIIEGVDFELILQIEEADGSVSEHVYPVSGYPCSFSFSTTGRRWDVVCASRTAPGEGLPFQFDAEVVLVDGLLTKCSLGLKMILSNVGSGYVMLPAALYLGTAFFIRPCKYPPMLELSDSAWHVGTPVVNDIPLLDRSNNESMLELTDGDMTSRWVVVHRADAARVVCVEAVDAEPDGSAGFTLSNSISNSALVCTRWKSNVRSRIYRHFHMNNGSDDQRVFLSAGESMHVAVRVHDHPCSSTRDALAIWFQLHGDSVPEISTVPSVFPFSSMFSLVEELYNSSQWNNRFGYYRVAPEGEGGRFGDWQAGWVGGGMTQLPLAMRGNAVSQQRSRMNMDAVFGLLQHVSGFICPMMYDGVPLGDNFLHPEHTGWTMIRKNADVLLYTSRCITWYRSRDLEVPASWIEGLGELTSACCRLWQDHSQFGQFVDIDNGSILVKGSCAGATMPGALAAASVVLGELLPLEIAKQSADWYCTEFLANGFTNGGPGEILQAPDSESAFGLLESLIELYQLTKEVKWLSRAVDAARLCSTWVVSHNFKFPDTSEFGRLGIQSRGAVWASVQNKHGAPGICTFSGLSLYKLYRATGDRRHGLLARDIARALPQFVSRLDRPIHTIDGRISQPGWVNERVNTSDWEGKNNIGEIFHGNCWSSLSCLLTYAEIPGIHVALDTEACLVADHVEANLQRIDAHSLLLEVHNTTTFDAVVSILAETSEEMSIPLPADPLLYALWCSVPAGATVEVVFHFDKTGNYRYSTVI